MSTADEYLLGRIVQYVGTTDANYTHGCFYECVSDGEEPPTYNWQITKVIKFDTTPTSGSANAVTSDGLFARTPFVRMGPNSLSAAGGWTCSASGSASLAYGRSASANGNYSVALGRGALTKMSNDNDGLLAAGRWNNPRRSDLFNIGNGTSDNARSNILEVNSTELNVNGDIKRNNVPIYPLVYDSETESYIFSGLNS